MTEELTRKRTSSIQHQHKRRADYNTIPINELINKIKVPGSKGFKILKELNDQQLKIMGTQYVKILNRAKNSIAPIPPAHCITHLANTCRKKASLL